MMPEKLHDFDPADMLEGEEAFEIFLADAFETGDTRHIASAHEAVARARERIARADAADRRVR